MHRCASAPGTSRTDSHAWSARTPIRGHLALDQTSGEPPVMMVSDGHCCSSSDDHAPRRLSPTRPDHPEARVRGLARAGHGARGDGDRAGFGYRLADRIDDVVADLVGAGDGQGGINPGFDLDAQGAAGPAGAGVGVADAGHRGGGCSAAATTPGSTPSSRRWPISAVNLRACHDNCVSHGWTKIGRRDHHSVGKGIICESGHQHRRL